MNRNTLRKICLLWAIFNLCLMATACTTAWTTEASNIISLLVPAIQAALGILAAFGLGISPSVLTAVNTWSSEAEQGLLTVKGLIEQYNAAEATSQPGILIEIQNALSVISSNLNTILPELHVTDPKVQAEIGAVFAAVANETVALLALVPAIQGKVTDHDEVKALLANLKSAKQFKQEFNDTVAVFGTQYQI